MPAGTITALRAQAKDPQRVNVFVNGEFAIGVSLNTISKEGLYVGEQLSEEDYARIERAEGHDKAFQAALRFLEARPRSAATQGVRRRGDRGRDRASRGTWYARRRRLRALLGREPPGIPAAWRGRAARRTTAQRRRPRGG